VGDTLWKLLQHAMAESNFTGPSRTRGQFQQQMGAVVQCMKNAIVASFVL
jgi:hypothetical protein